MLKQSNPRVTTTRKVLGVANLFALTVGFVSMLGSCAEPDMGCEKQIKITASRLLTGLEELQGSTIGPGSDL